MLHPPVPVVGKDVVVSEGRALPVQCLPAEVGLRRQPVEYTCVDASQQLLAVGSAQGYVWVMDLQSSRLLREFSVSIAASRPFCSSAGILDGP